MTKFARHFAALTCTALASFALLAGAVGPANTVAHPVASDARTIA